MQSLLLTRNNSRKKKVFARTLTTKNFTPNDQSSQENKEQKRNHSLPEGCLLGSFLLNFNTYVKIQAKKELLKRQVKAGKDSFDIRSYLSVK